MCTSQPVKSQKKETWSSMFEMLLKLAKNLLKCLIVQLHAIFDFFVDFSFSLYYGKNGIKVPPITDRLLLMSATELAEKIRTKEVSCEKVVRTFIDRAKKVNPIINAVVEERYEDALEEAREVDKLLEKEENIDVLKEKKPFLGVPFTTKDSTQAKGMLHTLGLKNRTHFRSKEDATVVDLVKKAGGILIAKTNVPELNLWCESRNHVYGQTCNPYDTTRNVGGSSGGEGAIITACGSAISIGSDIGGSTRMPAFFNGVFGHKPTEGLTPVNGIGLRQRDYYPNTMLEAGPMCKKAEDLVPFMKVLVGDKVSLLRLDTPVNVKSLNIFYQESSGDLRASKVNADMKAALLNAVQYFEEITGSATKIRIPGTEYTFRLWKFWMTQEEFDFKLGLTNGKYRADAGTELKKYVTGRSEFTLAAILKLIDEDFFPKENPEWARNVTANMRKFLMDKLKDNGILLYPSSPFPAGYHYTSYLRPFNFGYWCLFNVLRFPVCQVPLGLDKDGLPVGVQVVATPYNDHLCLAVARELEKRFGGWVPPS